jgi:hypothetical protein
VKYFAVGAQESMKKAKALEHLIVIVRRIVTHRTLRAQLLFTDAECFPANGTALVVPPGKRYHF